jgi:hypothetical protein
MGKQHAVLKDQTDRPPVNRQARDIVPVDLDPPSLGAQKSGDQLEEDRLADALRPQQDNMLTRLDPERQVRDPPGQEALAQPTDIDYRRG